MSKYKTKAEYEEEDSISHRRRMEKLQRRRDERRAEGYSCNSEGCGQQFEDPSEFEAHIKKHQDDNRRKMICNKSQCKDLKVTALVAKLGLNVI